MKIRSAHTFLANCFILLAIVYHVQSSVAGIDLGDESFKINMISPGKQFEIVQNTASGRKTPTALHFGDVRQFGNDAINRRASKPKSTFFYLQDFITAKNITDLEGRFISAEYKFDQETGLPLISGKYPKGTQDFTDFHTEQILGMVLAHAKQLMETHQNSKNPIQVTITIPSNYNYRQRQSILDAACKSYIHYLNQYLEIADLKTLFLLHENTAASLAYSITKKMSKQTQYFLYYNMGATSTKVSLVKYETVQNPKKKSDKHQQITIVAQESIDDFGGRALDNLIANELMDRYNELDKRKGKPDIRKNPRVVQRFLKQAQKVKEILSANKQARVSMMDVEKIQFKTTYSREQLQKVGEQSIFKRVTEPIESVIKSAGLENKDISQIQLIGGGIRVPRIQNEIKEFFKDTLASLDVSSEETQSKLQEDKQSKKKEDDKQKKGDKQKQDQSKKDEDESKKDDESKKEEQIEPIHQFIGTNLNGDQAMCHGAAFIAANTTSTRFAVKDIKLVEYNPFEYHININFKDGEKESIHRVVFSKEAVLGQRKKLAFSGMHDFQIEIFIRHYGQNKDEYQDQYVSSYQVKLYDGVRQKILKDLQQQKAKENSARTIIRFELTRSAIIQLADADVQYMTLNEYKKKVKKQVKQQVSDKAESTDTNEGQSSKDEKNSQENAKSQNSANETKDNQTTGQQNKQQKTEEEKSESKQQEQKQDKSKKQKQKKQDEYQYITQIKQIPAKLPFSKSKKRLTNNLTPQQINQMKQKLKQFDKIDKQIKMTAETLSNFESLIYQIRDEIDNYSGYMNEETTLRLGESVRVQMNWIEEQGFGAKLDQIQERKSGVQQEWNKVLHRKKTYLELFPAIQKGLERVKQVKDKFEKVKSEKDWLEEKDIQKVQENIDQTEKYILEKKEENQKQEKSEDPTTRAQTVQSKVKKMRDALKRLQKKKKPEEKKEEKKQQDDEKEQDQKKSQDEKTQDQKPTSQQQQQETDTNASVNENNEDENNEEKNDKETDL